MPTLRRALVVPALVAVVAAGCGSSKAAAPASTAVTSPAATTATTVAPSTSQATSAPSTTATTAPPTTLTPTTAGPPNSDKPVAGPGVEITVQVGVDDASTTGGRVEKVPVGSDVTLRILDAGRAETYHLHGYDLEQKVPQGVEASFEFTADKKGTFDVESHVTNKVLVTLQVS